MNELELRRMEREYLSLRQQEAAELDRLADELEAVQPLCDAMLTFLDEILAVANSRSGRHPVIRRGERDQIPPLTRRLVLRRDGNRCRWCEATSSLQLDHVIPWSAGGPDRSDNLRTLCERCNNDRSNHLEVGRSRIVGVTAVCDDCLERHDHAMWRLHDKSGLWFGCHRCRAVAWEPGHERVPAYCGTCDTTSWVSDRRRVL